MAARFGKLRKLGWFGNCSFRQIDPGSFEEKPVPLLISGPGKRFAQWRVYKPILLGWLDVGNHHLAGIHDYYKLDLIPYLDLIQ